MQDGNVTKSIAHKAQTFVQEATKQKAIVSEITMGKHAPPRLDCLYTS